MLGKTVKNITYKYLFLCNFTPRKKEVAPKFQLNMKMVHLSRVANLV